MNGRFVILGLLLASAGDPIFACSCMWKTMPPADYGASVVFRGTVTEKKTLPVRPEMKSRGRYQITFQVREVWKGPRQPIVVIYGVDNGVDCLGGSGLEVGSEYLIFASEKPSQDVPWPGTKTFWYGWTDVVPSGTRMLTPTVCAPGHKLPAVVGNDDALNRLGKGYSLPTGTK